MISRQQLPAVYRGELSIYIARYVATRAPHFSTATSSDDLGIHERLFLLAPGPRHPHTSLQGLLGPR